MRIGIHTSIAGSLERAALKAVELGANTFQIFSSSPRQWKAPPLSQPAIQLFRRARQRHDLRPLAIHGNYLINLAAANEGVRAHSVQAFRGEIERAVAIGAEFLVVHPGNYRGVSIEQGVLHFLQGAGKAAQNLNRGSLKLLIENTAGAGAQLGSRLEELHAIRQFADQFTDLPIGFCLDTCHLLAAGYDIATGRGLEQTVREIDRWLGLENVPVIHANDSKTPLASHVDRHENIGEGYIGVDGFRRILAHPGLRDKAFILETPMEKGRDLRNLNALKSLCRNAPTIITKSS
ncbi:MAG TPA: deoxyribonuclease IV [Bryobacteraceae bacterium]|nr:deoxyribonuclease IV [Bryobacteraceae bacterium]